MVGKSKPFKYHVTTKNIDITATTTRELAKLLGISMSSIQTLVHDPNKKHLLSRFITITREKNIDDVEKNLEI